ncbi:FAD-dependent oxidoreductase [Bacillus sp. SD088]|uniref:FAD-dependent oxidoreductase n=1 Tax=Bacillus sp. SD088 TaxID=2782012 RepID=UPI001A965383|nr:FAD-dependent oxidoreductase [Bacillus sp. SD088]MBO0993204.1 FAD-dependent oxidoreductase [Bacillus sp. SD088]
MLDSSKLNYYTQQTKSNQFVRIETDLCIYGGTSAGVTAAVQAKRMGLDVVILEFGRHLGGMTSSGLGATDIGNKEAIGGISRQFYRTLGKYYESDEPDGAAWKFEPSVAEEVFNTWIDEQGINVFYEQHLESVQKEAGRIKSIEMENGDVFSAKIFIDATYEGDLLAKAGVSYHIGREANSVYKETLNGIHFGNPNHNFKSWVDPYVVEGKPDSGLLYGITNDTLGYQGQGDSSIQAYNFRICLTDRSDIKMPFPKPNNYDPNKYALLARYIDTGVWDAMQLHRVLQNRKTDLNNYGGVSTDHIGFNYNWAEGDYETREKIFQDHVDYNLGMLYFLSHDERVPTTIREEVCSWGLPAGEFPETGGWPHQLYIREARRMISDCVMTERHCRGYTTAEDSIGLAAYTMDSHHCRRVIIDGRVINEGNVEISPTAPYPISYQAIVPKEDECSNLIVPVCLSSSHIAFGSIRMEPVFMVLGQSAATAAALAIEDDVSVQHVEYQKLRNKLIEDNQVLEWKRNTLSTTK